jgi:hypothetical protein
VNEKLNEMADHPSIHFFCADWWGKQRFDCDMIHVEFRFTIWYVFEMNFYLSTERWDFPPRGKFKICGKFIYPSHRFIWLWNWSRK